MEDNIKTKRSSEAPVDEGNDIIKLAKPHNCDYDKFDVGEFQKYIAIAAVKIASTGSSFHIELSNAILIQIQETLACVDEKGEVLSDNEKMTVLSDPHLIAVLSNSVQRRIMFEFDEGVGRWDVTDEVSSTVKQLLGKHLYS